MDFIKLQAHGNESVFLPHWFVAKFYHPVACTSCGYAAIPGFSDMDDTGPWDFECPRCHSKWSVAMTEDMKRQREETISLLRQVDALLIKLHESPYITLHKTVEEHSNA